MMIFICCGLEERDKEWMRRKRSAFKFRMKLCTDKKGMYLLRKLSNFHKLFIGRVTGENQPALFELCDVFWIYLVAMPMAFGDKMLAVALLDDRSFFERCRI